MPTFLWGNQIIILIFTPLQYWWCLFEWWTWLYTKVNIFLVDKGHVLQVKGTFLLLVFTYYSIITTTQELADVLQDLQLSVCCTKIF